MSVVLDSKPLYRKLLTAGSIAALLAVVVALHLLLLRLPTRVYEATDFLGYWAAASLFVHGENPYDQDALLALERDQGWAGADPMYSWNPPWLHLILSPLGALSFRQAAALWFVVNPLLIGVSALLIWDVVSRRTGAAQVALVLLAAFLYSRSLHAVLEGQVNTLVLVGGAAFLSLALRRRDFLAGAVLVLVTVKPHLSYLLLPAVVAASVRWKRWGILASFGAALSVLVLLVTVLFPAWPEAYLSLFQVAASPLEPARYVTPTFRGFLLAHTNFDIGAGLAVVCLGSFLAFIALRAHDLSLPTVASLSWIVGLPTAPFGWSTDQIVLLLPIVQILSWMPDLTTRQRRIGTLALVFVYAYALWMWLASYRDAAFLAVPPMIGILWGYTHWTVSGKPRPQAPGRPESADAAQH